MNLKRQIAQIYELEECDMPVVLAASAAERLYNLEDRSNLADPIEIVNLAHSVMTKALYEVHAQIKPTPFSPEVIQRGYDIFLFAFEHFKANLPEVAPRPRMADEQRTKNELLLAKLLQQYLNMCEQWHRKRKTQPPKTSPETPPDPDPEPQIVTGPHLYNENDDPDIPPPFFPQDYPPELDLGPGQFEVNPPKPPKHKVKNKYWPPKNEPKPKPATETQSEPDETERPAKSAYEILAEVLDVDPATGKQRPKKRAKTAKTPTAQNPEPIPIDPNRPPPQPTPIGGWYPVKIVYDPKTGDPIGKIVDKSKPRVLNAAQETYPAADDPEWGQVPPDEVWTLIPQHEG